MHKLRRAEFPINSVDDLFLQKELDKLGMPYTRRDEEGFWTYMIAHKEEMEDQLEMVLLQTMLTPKIVITDYTIPMQYYFHAVKYLRDNKIEFEHYKYSTTIHLVITAPLHEVDYFTAYLEDSSREPINEMPLIRMLEQKAAESVLSDVD